MATPNRRHVYLPAMKYCADRGIREALYRAFSTRASEFDGGKFDNTPLIKRILELRAEEASLLGFKNYGELSLATKMAKSPAEGLDFLRDVARRSKPRAEDDVAQVDAYARDELGIDKIEPWDRAYAAEKLREARYSYSDAEVKRCHYTKFLTFAVAIPEQYSLKRECTSASFQFRRRNVPSFV